MSTVLVSGVGAFGSYALEFLARSPGVKRIITVDRRPWSGPSPVNLTMIGAVFQGHTTPYEHHVVDLGDTSEMAQLLTQTRPDVILHSATVQSPRHLMEAPIDSALRELLRKATFGMWLPWHLLPATRLVEAIAASGVETRMVNVSFPDVVNAAIWRRFGYGPAAGAGNVEVCVAQIVRYLVDVGGHQQSDIDVRLVGSHALLGYGVRAGVPHHFRLTVAGKDVTGEYDLATMLDWPEPIKWSEVAAFSLFAASAVKNVLALAGSGETRTHVSGPNGLPGGYPVRIENGTIHLNLPEGLSPDSAVAINGKAARWDGVDRIEADGTVLYTTTARDAMRELGYAVESVGFDDLAGQTEKLTDLYKRLTNLGG